MTVTPYTETTFEKVLNTILVCYVRHIGRLNKNADAHEFAGNVKELISKIQARIPVNEQVMKQEAEEIINWFATDWLKKIDSNKKLSFKNDLIKKTEQQDDWSLMNSMREVDTTSLIKINIYQNNNNPKNKTNENGEKI